MIIDGLMTIIDGLMMIRDGYTCCPILIVEMID